MLPSAAELREIVPMQNHELIELVFIVLASVALIMQTILLIAVFVGMGKAIQSIKEEIGEIRSTVMPVVHNTRGLIERLSPKVEQTVGDITDIVGRLRAQTVELEIVSTEILQRVRKETGRIDNMFSGTLDAVDRASVYVTDVVSKPVRQISGILASIKAIVESLRTSETSYRGASNHKDKDVYF